MTRYISLYRRQFLGLSLLALLALAIALLVQAPSLDKLRTARQPAGDVGAGSAEARIQAAAEAADRKLQDPGYRAFLMEQTYVDPLAGVDPADRKFFTGNYTWTDPATVGLQAEAEAADRKLQDPGYLEFLMEQIRSGR
jgi:hypothetical protein